MSAQQQILREYLVALGFKVNTAEQKKTENSIKLTDKKIAALGATILGTVSGFAAMGIAFAQSMQRMYYNARYADTTIEKLQAMEYGAKSIGLEGGRATAVLKGMAAAMRGNPGLVGLMNGLGVKTAGRKMDDIAVDFTEKLKKMPFHVAQRYASLFGMSPEDLFNMEEGLDKLKKMREEREQMSADFGVNADEMQKSTERLTDQWLKTKEHVTLLGEVILSVTAGPIAEMLSDVNDLAKKWAQIVINMDSSNPKAGAIKMLEGLTGVAQSDRVTLTPEAKARIGASKEEAHGTENQSLSDWETTSREGDAPFSKARRNWERFKNWFSRRKGKPGIYDTRMPTDEAAVDAVTAPDERAPDLPAAAGDDPHRTGGQDPTALFSALEKKYNLPPGILMRYWSRESARGTNMVGRPTKYGVAEGHFQMIPSVQDAYGVVDPYNLKDSAEGAAHKLSDLLKASHGDQREAAARWNWGDGNLAAVGGDLGKAPPETQGFMDAVAPVSLTQHTNITVNGAGDPQETAGAISRSQKEVNSDIVRNLKPKVR